MTHAGTAGGPYEPKQCQFDRMFGRFGRPFDPFDRRFDRAFDHTFDHAFDRFDATLNF